MQTISMDLQNRYKEEWVDVYRFILITTGIILGIFSATFLYLQAWLAFSVIAIGFGIINPLCWILAKNKNPVLGRVLFVTSCNLYILLGSIACDNAIQVQFFFIATSITSIILFEKKEIKWTYISVALIIIFWFLTQIRASRLIPESYIAKGLPLFELQALSFTGAVVLSVLYLYFHLESIRKYYNQIHQSTLDVHQQKNKALDLLTNIANNVPGVVYQYRLSPDGKFSFPYSSMGTQQIYRLSPKDLENDPDLISKILHPDDFERIHNSVQQSAATLETWKCDFRVQFFDGEIQWRRGIAHPKKESDGSILWHGLVMDITHEKSMELDLEQSKKMTQQAARLASLGEIAGGIAHEINTPLMIITSKSALIERFLNQSSPNVDKAKVELEKVKQTTFRIPSIVRGLLTFARGGSAQGFVNVDVDQLLNDVLLLSSEKSKTHSVVLKFQMEASFQVFGNAVQLSQVLINLINNSIDAIKHLSEKWVVVEVSSVSLTHIRFSVTDSGLGLTTEQVDRLMQPFFTTKEVGQGTGLGLSISKGLVESHGSTLVYNETSKNTCFYFELKKV